MKIAILCICYNSYKEFLSYYESLRKSEKLSSFEVSIFLLDNSIILDKNRQKKINHISNTDQNFTYHKCNNNGYLGTVQKELNKLDFKSYKYEYISITNVDIKVEKELFSQLEDIKIDDSIGLLAPSIINKKNINKNPKHINKKSALKIILNIIIFSIPLAFKFQLFVNRYINYFYKKLKKSKTINSKKHTYLMPIYCAHGSFTLFTKKGFDLIIDEEYPIFLFGEELFFAEILRTKGLKTLFAPSLKILDDEHVSTGKLGNATYCKLNRKALIYILKRFYIRKSLI